MQRRRPGFLRAGQNEIEPLYFATPGSKHRRNVTEIFCSSYSILRSFGVRTRPRVAFGDTGRTLEKRCEDAPHSQSTLCEIKRNGRSCRAHLGILCWHVISRKLCCIATTCAIGCSVSALANEGMWLFNAPPLK